MNEDVVIMLIYVVIVFFIAVQLHFHEDVERKMKKKMFSCMTYLHNHEI